MDLPVRTIHGILERHGLIADDVQAPAMGGGSVERHVDRDDLVAGGANKCITRK